jgi:uncharacterized membrane-anchored protein YhcB (DUF1043 family)
MAKRLLSVRRILAVFGVAVGLLGWVAAFVAVRHTNDLEYRLVSAEAGLPEMRAVLAQKEDELAAVRLEYREYQDMSGHLDEVTGNLAGATVQLADLLTQIDAAEARLDQQQAEAREQQTSLTDTTGDSVTTTMAKSEAQPTAASEDLAIAPAGPNLHQFACMRGEMTRLVYIEYSDAIGEPPCSVVYQKGPPEQSSRDVPWRAEHNKGYCEARARELVENLRSSNWSCGPLSNDLGINE